MTVQQRIQELIQPFAPAIETALGEVKQRYNWDRYFSDPLDRLAVQYALSVREFMMPYMRDIRWV